MTTEDIIQKLHTIHDKWESIRERAFRHQNQWQSVLPSDAPEIIDETLETLVRISQRIGQISGSGRALKLAIASASQQLASAEQLLTQISNTNHWTQLPHFINSLSAVSSAIYGIYILSSQEGQDAIKEACTQLTDKLTNLEALHEKLKEIERHALDLEQSLEKTVTGADQEKNDAEQYAEQAGNWANEAEEFRNSAEKAAQNALRHKQTITELAKQAEQLKNSQKQLETLTKEAEEIRSTLESLLPGATSAGLAYAYNQNRTAIEERMKSLFWQFLGGLIALLATLVISHLYLGELPSEPVALILQLLARGMLAAPAIWFTWVVARQYAYLSRLHTDYGFKEAMATSLEGFRRMMEELDENEHKELTAALSIRAIDIIGADPDRLNVSHQGDESPFSFMWRSLMKRMFSGNKEQDNDS